MRVRVSPERKVIWRARCNLTTARRRQGLSVCVLLSSPQFRLISFFRDARKLHFSVQWSSATADAVVTCYCAWRTSLLISLASDSVVIRLSAAPPLDAVLPDVMQVPKGRHCSLEFQVTLSKTSLPAHVVVVVVVVVWQVSPSCGQFLYLFCISSFGPSHTSSCFSINFSGDRQHLTLNCFSPLQGALNRQRKCFPQLPTCHSCATPTQNPLTSPHQRYFIRSRRDCSLLGVSDFRLLIGFAARLRCFPPTKTSSCCAPFPSHTLKNVFGLYF